MKERPQGSEKTLPGLVFYLGHLKNLCLHSPG